MKTTFVIIVLSFAALYLQAEAGVDKCYFCAVHCSNPLKIVYCPTTEEEDSLCVSMRVPDPGTHSDYVYKGCGPNTDEFKASCAERDKVDGNSCKTCDTDLCNDSSSSSGFDWKWIIYIILLIILVLLVVACGGSIEIGD